MQKIYNVIVLILLVLLAGSFTGLGIQTHRLGCYRRQLDSTRMELSAATNRQSELTEILRRDSEILSESADTIQGIREQISEIRKSYEAMEDIINSLDSGGGGGR